jgi:hypothetical protein
MSRAGVGLVVETLLTDESLRIRLAGDRMEALAELYVRGFELSGEEMDLFHRTDPRLWFPGDLVGGEWRH